MSMNIWQGDKGRMRRMIVSHGSFHEDLILGPLAEEFETP